MGWLQGPTAFLPDDWEDADWEVYAWDADRHDSIEYALIREENSGHLLATLVITPNRQSISWQGDIQRISPGEPFCRLTVTSGTHAAPISVDLLRSLLSDVVAQAQDVTARERRWDIAATQLGEHSEAIHSSADDRRPEPSSPRAVAQALNAWDSNRGNPSWSDRSWMKPSLWVPSVMLVAFGALLLQMASQREANVPQALADLTARPFTTLLVAAVSLLVAAIVSYAFRFASVRLMEGHWGASALTFPLVKVATERHLRRKSRLEHRYQRSLEAALRLANQRMLEAGFPRDSVAGVVALAKGEPVDHLDADLLALTRIEWEPYVKPQMLTRIDRTASRLDEYPPHHYIMPTMIGNILRVAEADQAIGRSVEYSSSERRHVESLLDTLEMYCVLFVIFLLLASAGMVLLVESVATRGLWTAVFTLLAAAGYVGALSAARALGVVYRRANIRTNA